MARNDEEEIRIQEIQAVRLGYYVVERSIQVGERELSDQFRWIADNLMPERMSALTPVERKRVRQEISKRTKELSDVVKAKYIKLHLTPFLCNDQYDECVRKKKRQKKSTYLCDLALLICLLNSMTPLLAAIAIAAKAGHHLL